eukprot:408039-Amphidinium_carterae.1
MHSSGPSIRNEAVAKCKNNMEDMTVQQTHVVCMQGPFTAAPDKIHTFLVPQTLHKKEPFKRLVGCFGVPVLNFSMYARSALDDQFMQLWVCAKYATITQPNVEFATRWNMVKAMLDEEPELVNVHPGGDCMACAAY